MSCKSCRSAEDLASSKGSPATGEPPQLQCTAAQLQCVQHEIAIATIEGLRKESGSTEAICFADIHESIMQLVIKTTLWDAYAAYKLKRKCALSFVLPKVTLHC